MDGHLHTRKSKAWGLWFAVWVLPDGRRFEGSGTSEGDAAYRARLQSEPCEGCGRSVRQAEAELSRRACSRVLCSDCRRRVYGPSSDPDEER